MLTCWLISIIRRIYKQAAYSLIATLQISLNWGLKTDKFYSHQEDLAQYFHKGRHYVLYLQIVPNI